MGLAIIVVILVIGVLGFVGWRVFVAQTGNSSTGNNQTGNTQPSTDTYLDIKELGVKIKLSDSIKDAVYAPMKSLSTDEAKVFGISSQALIDSNTNNNGECAASQAPLGFIRATTVAPTYVGSDRPLPIDNQRLFKINDTYYDYSDPQGTNSCGLTKSSGTTYITSDLLTSKLHAIAESFKTLQLDH